MLTRARTRGSPADKTCKPSDGHMHILRRCCPATSALTWAGCRVDCFMQSTNTMGSEQQRPGNTGPGPATTSVMQPTAGPSSAPPRQHTCRTFFLSSASRNGNRGCGWRQCAAAVAPAQLRWRGGRVLLCCCAVDSTPYKTALAADPRQSHSARRPRNKRYYLPRHDRSRESSREISNNLYL